MKPVARGLWLSIANTVVIALGLAVLEQPGGRGEIFAIVVEIGIIPAMVVGLFLGWLAGKMATYPRAPRRIALAIPAFMLVFVLGSMFLPAFILVSLIPTTVAVLMLERGTRVEAPPPVPVAKVET